MSTGAALSAIGGAIDRATLALLWPGRGAFVLAALGAAACTAGAAYTWWNAPTFLTPLEHNPSAGRSEVADINKVHRNMKRLIGQGGPTSNLQAYIDSEGVTREQLMPT